MRLNHLHWTPLFAAALLALAPRSPAAEVPPLEDRVKAGCLYNFAKFIDWPAKTFASANAPVVIGILGEDPLVPVLAELVAGVRIGAHPLEVRPCRQAAEARVCQVLFIGVNGREQVAELLGATRNAPVLTVSEAEGFVQAGGIIQLTRQAGKVRFVIQAGQAGRAGLKISSQLLKVASAVLWDPVEQPR